MAGIGMMWANNRLEDYQPTKIDAETAFRLPKVVMSAPGRVLFTSWFMYPNSARTFWLKVQLMPTKARF